MALIFNTIYIRHSKEVGEEHIEWYTSRYSDRLHRHRSLLLPTRPMRSLKSLGFAKKETGASELSGK